MKKLSWFDLEKKGASQKAMKGYNETQPLDVYEDLSADDRYTVIDADGKHEALTFDQVNDRLEGWVIEDQRWYAVQKDPEDEWGNGSFDYDEAVRFLKFLRKDGYENSLIAVIVNDECVEEIRDI